MVLKKLCVAMVLSGSLVAHSGDAAVDKDGLIRIFKTSGENLYDALIDLWKTKAPFKTRFDLLKARLEKFGTCNQKPFYTIGRMASGKSWESWRYDKESCPKDNLSKNDWTLLKLESGKDILPDDFRRYTMRSFETAVGKALAGVQLVKDPKELTMGQKKRHIVWAAIGTPGPGSDIDTVANYHPDEEKPLPKIVIETMAKSLFDALGIAMYNQATGVNFDTESYIDVTADLDKAKYTRRIASPVYKNLGFTLAFIQIVRQLEHKICINTPKHSMCENEKKVFDLDMLNKAWRNSSAQSLLTEAIDTETITKVDGTAMEKIKQYLPIINHFARKAGRLEEIDDLAASKIKGILGTYFPEAYYTREALAHVCYSDDRYSQLLLSKASDHLKKSETITEDEISEFKAHAITPDYFIYLVSALENFGYFLHKVNGDKTAYESLKESSKYLFRIARALAGYWGVDVDADAQLLRLQETGSKTIKDTRKEYVVTLFQTASKLERLKRGFLPFSSIEDVQKVITRVKTGFKGPVHFEPKEESKEPNKWKKAGEAFGRKKSKNIASVVSEFAVARKIYHTHINIYLSKKQKEDKLKEAIEKFNLVVVWNDAKKMFDTPPDSEEEKDRIDALSGQEKKRAIIEKLEKRGHARGFISLLNLIIGVDGGSHLMQEQKTMEETSLKQTADLPNWRVKKQDSRMFDFSKERLFTASAAQLREFLKGLNSFLIYTTANYQKKNAFTFTPVGLNRIAEVEIANSRRPETSQD